MLSTLLLAAVAVTAIQDTDVTVAAEGVRRVDVDQMAGSVTLRAWGRSEIRVQVEHSRRAEVDIDQRGALLSIETDQRQMHEPVHYTIDVPSEMDVTLEGLQLRVDIEGIDGEIDIESMQGPVRVRDSRGLLEIETLAGAIQVDDFTGTVAASSTGHRITLRRVRGDIEVTSVGGPIRMTDIEATSLEAESVGGPIEFSGSLAPRGDYVFSTHGGFVELALDPGHELTLEVSNFSGAVEMDYPNARLVESAAGTMLFDLGGGGTMVEVATFSGSVLVRERR